ncbi:MAG: hypothetical protein EG825_05835 [Rhodocyclaceae bacterium]|nr:hypothetical protein [Rhodocyclaceae bacterium]
MIDRPTQPLELAARVLAPTTMIEVRQSPFSPRGWEILDRMAVNNPTDLRTLEARGAMALIQHVLHQQGVESEALARAEGCDGLTEHEILELLGADTTSDIITDGRVFR